MTKFYIGEGRSLADADFVRLATKHGIEEARLRAVNQVEARNKGSHSSGALVCLYEPHIAWRNTSGATRKKLGTAGIAYAKWKSGNYPKSSFPRIDKCAELAGEEIAALSTSWGLGQIMGFNHGAAGFPDAVAMVRNFAESEANQLEGMIRFIKANNKMLAALKTGDWKTFARAYNGPGYAKHNYHGWLAKAHARWVRKIAARGPLPPVPDDDETPDRPSASPAGWLGALVKLLTAIFGKKKGNFDA